MAAAARLLSREECVFIGYSLGMTSGFSMSAMTLIVALVLR